VTSEEPSPENATRGRPRTLATLVQGPDLPELRPEEIPASAAGGELELSGALVEVEAGSSIGPRRVRIRESELRGLVLDTADAPGLTLVDVLLRDCGLSNVDGREGVVTRVEVHRSRLVGFSLSRGAVRDLRVADSSMKLASFAQAQLRNVVLERVNLTEASFMDARLEGVAFIDCQLAGADFRGARLNGCVIRGSSLEDVMGVASLRGLRMPWPDIVASAGAMATALGIAVGD
jgi:uncharacterized protein YjbI with pentapeptide repeats